MNAARLEVVIDRIFPFENIKEAFAYLERGHTKGKVLVSFENDARRTLSVP